MNILRTDDRHFANLSGFDFTPHYIEIPADRNQTSDGQKLRVHYLKENTDSSSEVILCMHGEPSWCYLYRKMIPLFTQAGFGVLAPDLIGFGRSDKLARLEDYSYARHIAWMSAWLEAVDGQNLTLIGQDWGGLIGLRLVCAYPDRFKRIVVANTGLPVGAGANEDFMRWLEFSQNVPNFPVGEIVAGACQKGLSDEEKAAYNAPFPEESYKAGARCFPRLVPITKEHDQVEENKQAWKILEQWDKPLLTAFSNKDPVSAGGEKIFQERVKGAKGQPHKTIEGGGHFLQEDCGEDLANTVINFIRSNP